MTRLILLGFLMVFILSIGVALKSCQSTAPDIQAPVVAKGDSGIVALRDGATLVAQKGTVGRALVDWFASDDASPRSFELGGQEFLGTSSELTIESKGRLPRLIAMLKANPDVTVHVIGHTDPSGDVAADRALSQARAKALAELLIGGGISRSRLSFEGVGATVPIADNALPEGRARNRRVSLVLTRER
ncbi:OmpA family protein [Sphingobium aquiterrae]|uniref:OmpA family protein n=1 Tax=Sphingobium aquiterrae TaxID=2038656 RepID=UPI0030191762